MNQTVHKIVKRIWNETLLADDQVTEDQRDMILGWSLGIGAMTLLFLVVIFLMWRDEHNDKRKLYNFDPAPR
jgi:hypothetical protein